jgi:hypothetical protein
MLKLDLKQVETAIMVKSVKEELLLELLAKGEEIRKRQMILAQ